MTIQDFTANQRYVIAEYIFSYQQDILIKSDATQLIDVLHSKGLISDFQKDTLGEEVSSGSKKVADKLAVYLVEVISEEVRNEIMKEYYEQG